MLVVCMVQTSLILRMCAVYYTSYRFSPKLSPKLLQQRPGVLQVGGVKALGESAIDRCQQLTSLIALALALPQPAQDHGGPQLPGFGLLATGNCEGLLETGFRLGRVWDGLVQQQLALEPECLRE